MPLHRLFQLTTIKAKILPLLKMKMPKLVAESVQLATMPQLWQVLHPIQWQVLHPIPKIRKVETTKLPPPKRPKTKWRTWTFVVIQKFLASQLDRQDLILPVRGLIVPLTPRRARSQQPSKTMYFFLEGFGLFPQLPPCRERVFVSMELGGFRSSQSWCTSVRCL